MDLLLVESHRSLARSLRIGLEEEGFTVHAVNDPGQVDGMFRTQQFAAIVLDDASDQAQATLQQWRQARITTPVLILSTPGRALENLTGLGLGPGAFLAKPFGFDDLLSRLAKLTQNGRPS